MEFMRTSERKDLKRCPQKWQWAWVEGLKSQRPKNPFWFGIGIHEALALWYKEGKKRGPHPAQTWLEYCGEEERFIPQDYEDDKLKYIEARELGEIMLNGYLELYGKDPRWHVIATEQTFQSLIPKPGPLPKRVTPNNAIGTYLGTFDGVYRDLKDDTIWLMEHKTAASIDTSHLPLDDQAGSYWFVAGKVLRQQGLIGKSEEISGIMYNFLRKGTPDTRPVNENGVRCNKPTKAHYLQALTPVLKGNSIKLDKLKVDDLAILAEEKGITVFGDESKSQPPPLFHREPVWRSSEERMTMLKRIQDEFVHKQNILNGITPVLKNTTRDCTWDCDFYRMCMLHEANADWEEFKELAFVTKDPYSDHRANRKSA